MLRTLECEAAVFGCQVIHHQDTPASRVLAAPGAERLLTKLPGTSWGIVALTKLADATRDHSDASLPMPDAAICASGDGMADRLHIVDRLGADPLFCLAVEDTPDGIDAALGAGMKVIGVAGTSDGQTLGSADMVIPTLRSLHVVGTHPVLVLEVDALPNIGRFHPGQIKRR